MLIYGIILIQYLPRICVYSFDLVKYTKFDSIDGKNSFYSLAHFTADIVYKESNNCRHEKTVSTGGNV